MVRRCWRAGDAIARSRPGGTGEQQTGRARLIGELIERMEWLPADMIKLRAGS